MRRRRSILAPRTHARTLVRDSQTPWPSCALACQTRVRGVDGFDDMDAKKKGVGCMVGVCVKGVGCIVGVCVDNDTLPVYYESKSPMEVYSFLMCAT